MNLHEKLLSEKIANPKEHWFWDSWVLLALSATCCFVACNLLIAELSYLGPFSIMYFSCGSMLVCILYFYISSKKSQKDRVLIWTNGQLDFSLIGCYFVGGLFAIGIFMAISITFRLSARAGLNIGIAQTIWGFTPFLSSILDFLIYGTRLQLYHVAGISCMLAAAICISLSNLFKDAQVNADPVNPLPIYIPVIVSMTMPVICSSFSMFTKYVFKNKKISAQDLSFGYFLLVRGSFTLASIIYFQFETLNWKLWIAGFIGGVFDVIGCCLANCAISTGKPVGPIFALIDAQVLLVTVIVAVRHQIIPHWMQCLGLGFGVVGASVLSLTRYLMQKWASRT